MIFRAGLCRKDAEVMVHIHIQFQSQESAAKVPLALA